MAAHDSHGSGCDEDWPVLIIGGGLAGLSTAVFLGLRGVRAVVAERHRSTSIHPRARGQVPTTMEALRAAGVDQRMREASPDDKLSVVIAESLTGREIFAHIADEYPDFSRYSDAGWAMASQESAERILADRAVELGADLRFGTGAETSAQDADGVTVMLRDRASGALRTVRSGYVVAADGHRGRSREQLGIGVHGRGVLATAMSIVFEADLADALRGRRVALYHMRGSLPGATFVTTDDPRRHNVHVGIGDGDWDEQRCADAVRIVTGIPDLPVRILSYAPWDTAAWVADRFAQGRVFLAGDAARVMPPTGGMGGNSAILDGFSLAWKLAMVVCGQAGPRLLDSHDPERRSFAEELVEQQYAAMTERTAPDRRDETAAPQIDPATFLFGFRYLHGAFTPAVAGPRYEDPAAPSGTPGSRLPLLPPAADPRSYQLTLLTASPQWARQGSIAASTPASPWTSGWRPTPATQQAGPTPSASAPGAPCSSAPTATSPGGPRRPPARQNSSTPSAPSSTGEPSMPGTARPGGWASRGGVRPVGAGRGQRMAVPRQRHHLALAQPIAVERRRQASRTQLLSPVQFWT